MWNSSCGCLGLARSSVLVDFGRPAQELDTPHHGPLEHADRTLAAGIDCVLLGGLGLYVKPRCSFWVCSSLVPQYCHYNHLRDFMQQE